MTFECDEPARARRDKAGGRRRARHHRHDAGRDRRLRARPGRGRRRPLPPARGRAGRPRPGPRAHPGPVLGLRAAVGHRRRGAGLSSAAGPTSSRSTRTRSTTCSSTIRTVAARGRRRPSAATRSSPGCGRGSTRVAGAVAGRPRPRVAVVEWVDPPFTAGHWIPDLVRGGRRRTGRLRRRGSARCRRRGRRSRAAAPDVVVVSPCGYHLDGAAAQARGGARATLPGVAGVGHRRRRADRAARARASSPASRRSRRSCIRTCCGSGRRGTQAGGRHDLAEDR